MRDDTARAYALTASPPERDPRTQHGDEGEQCDSRHGISWRRPSWALPRRLRDRVRLPSRSRLEQLRQCWRKTISRRKTHASLIAGSLPSDVDRLTWPRIARYPMTGAETTSPDGTEPPQIQGRWVRLAIRGCGALNADLSYSDAAREMLERGETCLT